MVESSIPLQSTINQQPTLMFVLSSDSLEKSSMSFFKRPIRMRRDKKSPPAPLIVNSAPSSGGPHTTHSSSSHSGAKVNSLLTAAARSIRTGDSRLFESFQAALSPKPLQSQFPPPAHKNNLNFHSHKRIPVPSYSPHQTHPPAPKSDSLIRATSLERPRTVTKHSRTTSLPYSQAPPTLQPPPSLKTHSHQDLADSLEKLSGPERTLSQLFDRPPNSSLIHSHSTPHLQFDHELTQSKSDLSHNSSPFDSSLFSLDFSTHSHIPNPTTPTSAHRTSFNPSFEQSRDMVSKALAKPSTPCLPQLGSQVSLPVPPSVHSSSHRSSLYSSTGLSRGLSARPNDFLESKKKSISAREAQRRSFQNMPLPALPLPSSPKPPPSSAFLELPPILNFRNHQRTNGFQIPRKQQRPWSIASPGSYNDPRELEKSLSKDKPSFDSQTTTTDQNIFSRTSPLKVSILARQNRHSYPSQSSISNLSPLERVSDHLKSVYSTNPTHHPLLRLPTSHAGSIGQRENDALRLTPSITPPCGNLMFGFRGEVFEIDKYQKPTVLGHSVKAPTESDPHITSPQPSPHAKLSQVFIGPKTNNSVEINHVGLSPPLPPRSNSLDARSTLPQKAHAIHQPKVVPVLCIKTQPEFEELGEFIELKEICLIGSDLLDLPNDHFRPNSNPVEEPTVVEPSSPRNSERNCSTEIALESLSVDRGSSEEETSRLLEESVKFDSGPEPKIINPETSLEMAASILGQPVPPISKEIRRGFERIHYLFSDGRSKDSAEKDKQEFMTKILKSIDHKIGESIKTSDVAIQTDPVEFVTSRSSPSIFQPSAVMFPKISNRRIADALKKFASRNDLSDHSKENLPLNLTRHSMQSEQSFVSASRSYGATNKEEDQQESLRTSGGMTRSSPRSDYTTERPTFRKQRLSEMSDSNRRFSSTWTTHSIQTYGQNTPLRKNTGESHLGLQINTSTLNESLLDALDKALRAEESFQREKQHLQSVARRQSQTIESLLIDKEVLSLEVSRLTGLVELLARDHNLLNDRIDKAEQALDKFPPSASSNRISGHISQNPDETMNYFTASGERMMILKEDKDEQSDSWNIKQSIITRKMRRKGPTSGGGGGRGRGNLTETDDGMMAGDSEDWEDGMEDDGESLCDPEQSSFLNDPLSFDYVVHPHKVHLDPIPDSYPRLAPPTSHSSLPSTNTTTTQVTT